MSSFKNLIINIQCVLRNQEGITGINVLYHIVLCILIKKLDEGRCNALNIATDYTYEKIKELNDQQLYDIISDTDTGLINNLRNFGFVFSLLKE